MLNGSSLDFWSSLRTFFDAILGLMRLNPLSFFVWCVNYNDSPDPVKSPILRRLVLNLELRRLNISLATPQQMSRKP